MGKNKLQKIEPSPPVKEKKFKTSLVRICLLIITIVIVYFCASVLFFLQDMNNKVTDIQQNLHLMTQMLGTTNDHVKKTVKKINDSWLLSW